MALEIAVNQTLEQVHAALLQFAAQRGYALTRPSRRPDLVHLEAPCPPAEKPLRGVQGRSAAEAAELITTVLQEGLTSGPTPMRVDLSLFWRRGKTILAFESGQGRGQLRLVEELRSFLTAAPATVGTSTVVCPQCGTPVTNTLAKFCGRCGKQIADGE